MKIRKLLAAAALSTGLAALDATPASAADPVKKPTCSGSARSKAATPEAAKAKADAWLKSVGKFDQTAFDKVWADESRTVLDRTADSLALGNAEAAALLTNVRKADAPAPAETPAILKDMKQDSFFRTNLALAFAKAAASKKVYEEALEALNAATPEVAVDPAALYFFKAVCRTRHHAEGRGHRLHRQTARRRGRRSGPLQDGRHADVLRDAELVARPEGSVQHRTADGQQRPAPRTGPRRREDPGHPEEDRVPAR